jgi:hypothetical protein
MHGILLLQCLADRSLQVCPPQNGRQELASGNINDLPEFPGAVIMA